MGNCNTCNCDGKGEANPIEFNMDVTINNFLALNIGLSKAFEDLSIANDDYLGRSR